MKTKLTRQDVKKYLEKDGAYCPYCNSDNIEAQDRDYSTDVFQRVVCLSCGKTWTDVYRLVGVDDIIIHETEA